MFSNRTTYWNICRKDNTMDDTWYTSPIIFITKIISYLNKQLVEKEINTIKVPKVLNQQIIWRKLRVAVQCPLPVYLNVRLTCSASVLRTSIEALPSFRKPPSVSFSIQASLTALAVLPVSFRLCTKISTWKSYFNKIFLLAHSCGGDHNRPP